MNKIRVLFLDVKNAKEPQIIEVCNDNNDDFHRLIGCDMIDVTQRTLGGKKYCIVADDEGALKYNRKLSVWSFNSYERIYGNVIIANFDGVEDLSSLEDVDVVRLLMCQARYVTDKPYTVLKTDQITS